MSSKLVIFSSIVLFGVVLQNSKCDGSKRYNSYLAHIFNTYGNGGSMPFEGLEHLMHNLGLGGQEFNPTHTIEEHRPDGYKLPEFIFEEDDEFINKLKTNHKKTDDGNNLKVDMRTNDMKLDLDALPEIKYENSEKNINPSTVDGDTLEQTVLDSFLDKSDKDRESNPWSELVFKEMHDPKHRHPRHHDKKSASARRCLSPFAMMKLVVDEDAINTNNQKLNYMVEDNEMRTKRHVPTYEHSDIVEDEEESELEFFNSMRITPAIFMKMCPALLVQIDQSACAQKLPHANISAKIGVGYAYAWIYSTIAVLIISCCGLLGVAIIPLAKTASYDDILKFLVAIAVGTLCGDAFMHLLPHALSSHGENEDLPKANKEQENDLVWICTCAFITSLVMYSLETLLPFLKGSEGQHTHSHSHSYSHQQPQMQVMDNAIALSDVDEAHNSKRGNVERKEISIMLEETQIDKKGKSKLSPVALMVILGDGLHNITDGLAIGAAFATDPITGMATAFAVLCHELPHELGDFALLLRTGVNIQKALLLNIGSSILSFMGMAVGLVVAGVHTNMVRWIYASTAGSFLYIALTDLLPEIKNSEQQNAKSCLLQILGIFLGGGIMMVIALNEDQLRILFE